MQFFFLNLLNNSKHLHWKCTHTNTQNLISPQTQTGRSCCQGSVLSAVSLVSIYCASVISGKRGACADPEGCQEQYPPDPQRLPSAERQRRMLNKKKKKKIGNRAHFFFSQAPTIPNSSFSLHLLVSGGYTVSRDFRSQLRVAPALRSPTFAP